MYNMYVLGSNLFVVAILKYMGGGGNNFIYL